MALRQLHLTAPRTVVYRADTALDLPPRSGFALDAAGDAAYEVAVKAALAPFHAGYDLAQLPLRPGAKPTVFHVVSLTAAQVAHIDGLPDLGAQVAATIAYAVVKVENFEVADGAGGTVLLEATRRKDVHGERLDEATLTMFADNGLRWWLYLECRKACSLTTEARKSG